MARYEISGGGHVLLVDTCGVVRLVQRGRAPQDRFKVYEREAIALDRGRWTSSTFQLWDEVARTGREAATKHARPFMHASTLELDASITAYGPWRPATR